MENQHRKPHYLPPEPIYSKAEVEAIIKQFAQLVSNKAYDLVERHAPAGDVSKAIRNTDFTHLLKK